MYDVDKRCRDSKGEIENLSCPVKNNEEETKKKLNGFTENQD